MDASAEAGWSFVGIGPKLKGRCSQWAEDFADGTWLRIALGE